MKRIKFFVKGGLGNQLFQLALMLTLRDKLGFQIEYSLLDVKHDQKREPESECLLRKLGFVQSNEFLLDSQCKIFYKLRKKLLVNFFKKNCLVERQYPYDPDVYDILENVISGDFYVEGYFQTKEFALTNKAKIKNAIHESVFLNLESEYYKNIIKNTKHSVSIHVRRGDYVSNQAATTYHGICSDEYYRAGVSAIKRTENDNIFGFFVFSDDIDWCKDNIAYLGLSQSDKIHFIERNERCDSYQDLLLMSYCRSKIIANSTYSWWGVILSEINDSGLSVAPKKWFISQEVRSINIFDNEWSLV